MFKQSLQGAHVNIANDLRSITMESFDHKDQLTIEFDRHCVGGKDLDKSGRTDFDRTQNISKKEGIQFRLESKVCGA